ncbi:dual specificity phosphatase [Coccidioides immitis RS]|uniref:phosphatidylinositol-3,4,5-trisphosphate 3-phosphatase n=4 Tax=Coccidioides TaxID=5500 RepID=J3KFH6_COCIM|nr:dual specificity phosphatase [Coccidioides immitis RS]EAS34382.3 dual specificity phosphatase [Coccidioides immitis RS]
MGPQASILRQIVAGPRLRHPEARLDLCYVTDEIIATSGPSSTYPQRAYRNPTDALVRFLDLKHGENWAIWEFRAEGTGYPDKEVYGRIHHFPWPDHHPPPFSLIPPMMASMRNWLTSKSKGKRVIVVHCKAGKGRSGTATCSYLISEQGWKAADALKQFTERRMRVGFGPGVSIPSQVRYVGYVDRWANKYNKKYVERPVEILEIHIWGLRHGLKVQVEGFVDEGRKIKCFHRFHRSERTTMDGDKETQGKNLPNGNALLAKPNKEETISNPQATTAPTPVETTSPFQAITEPEPLTRTVENISFFSKTPPPRAAFSSVLLRPHKPLIIPTSDINIDFERRATAAYSGWTMVTSVAHVWFNAFFEGGHEHDSGVFEEEWGNLDGIKGTSSKGTRAFDRLKVVWKYTAPSPGEEGAIIPGGPPLAGQVVSEPAPGEEVHEGHAADWRGADVVEEDNLESGEQASSESDENSAPQDTNNKENQTVDRARTKQLRTSSFPSDSLLLKRSPLSVAARRLGLRRRSSATAGVSLVNAPGNSATNTSEIQKPRENIGAGAATRNISSKRNAT